MRKNRSARENEMLEIAVRHNSLGNVKKALELGANPNAATTDAFGEPITLFTHVCKNERFDIAEALLDAGADPNHRSFAMAAPPIVKVSATGSSRAICFMLDHGADINAKSSHGKTALHISASMGWTSVAEILLEKGINFNERDNMGATALHQAISAGDQSQNIFGMLISIGADVNMQNNSGWTPLMYCAVKGYTENMKTLIEAGADSKIRNRHNETAYDILKKKYPDKYADWICQTKKHMLEYEDMEGTGHMEHVPDFSI